MGRTQVLGSVSPRASAKRSTRNPWTVRSSSSIAVGLRRSAVQQRVTDAGSGLADNISNRCLDERRLECEAAAKLCTIHFRHFPVGDDELR